MSILIVGSVALDTIETPLGKKEDVLGGSAVYSSVSAEFFFPVNLIGVIGSDFPHKYVSLLKKRNVGIEGLEIKKGRTFRWSGRYSWNFNEVETLSTHLNVFSEFRPKIPSVYKNSRYVFLANIDPDLQKEVLKQVRKPKLVFCDTMNHWIANKRRQLIRTLKDVDVFFLNDSEARQLTGKRNLIKAARAIQGFGPERVVVKKGEHGVLLFLGKRFFCLPAFLLEDVFDPTGAGDSFAGGFIGYLAGKGKVSPQSFKEAAVYGSITASFAVEDFSLNKLLSISRKDIENRVRKFRKLSSF